MTIHDDDPYLAILKKYGAAPVTPAAPPAPAPAPARPPLLSGPDPIAGVLRKHGLDAATPELLDQGGSQGGALPEAVQAAIAAGKTFTAPGMLPAAVVSARSRDRGTDAVPVEARITADAPNVVEMGLAQARHPGLDALATERKPVDTTQDIVRQGLGQAGAALATTMAGGARVLGEDPTVAESEAVALREWAGDPQSTAGQVAGMAGMFTGYALPYVLPGRALGAALAPEKVGAFGPLMQSLRAARTMVPAGSMVSRAGATGRAAAVGRTLADGGLRGFGARQVANAAAALPPNLALSQSREGSAASGFGDLLQMSDDPTWQERGKALKAIGEEGGVKSFAVEQGVDVLAGGLLETLLSTPQMLGAAAGAASRGAGALRETAGALTDGVDLTRGAIREGAQALSPSKPGDTPVPWLADQLREDNARSAYEAEVRLAADQQDQADPYERFWERNVPVDGEHLRAVHGDAPQSAPVALLPARTGPIPTSGRVQGPAIPMGPVTGSVPMGPVPERPMLPRAPGAQANAGVPLDQIAKLFGEPGVAGTTLRAATGAAVGGLAGEATDTDPVLAALGGAGLAAGLRKRPPRPFDYPGRNESAAELRRFNPGRDLLDRDARHRYEQLYAPKIARRSLQEDALATAVGGAAGAGLDASQGGDPNLLDGAATGAMLALGGRRVARGDAHVGLATVDISQRVPAAHQRTLASVEALPASRFGYSEAFKQAGPRKLLTLTRDVERVLKNADGTDAIDEAVGLLAPGVARGRIRTVIAEGVYEGGRQPTAVMEFPPEMSDEMIERVVAAKLLVQGQNAGPWWRHAPDQQPDGEKFMPGHVLTGRDGKALPKRAIDELVGLIHSDPALKPLDGLTIRDGHVFFLWNPYTGADMGQYEALIGNAIGRLQSVPHVDLHTSTFRSGYIDGARSQAALVGADADALRALRGVLEERLAPAYLKHARTLGAAAHADVQQRIADRVAALDALARQVEARPPAARTKGQTGNHESAAEALAANTRRAFGAPALRAAERTPESRLAHRVTVMEQLVDDALGDGSHTGRSWYDGEMDDLDAVAKLLIPELRDPAKLGIFHAVAAVLSNGQRVTDNIEAALHVMEQYVQTGRLSKFDPEKVGSQVGRTRGGNAITRYTGPAGRGLDGDPIKGHVRQNVHEAQLRALQDLIAQHGEQGAVERLMSSRRLRTGRELPYSVELLGQKLGQFFRDLRRAGTSGATIDLWIKRLDDQLVWGRVASTADKGYRVLDDRVVPAQSRELQQAIEEVARRKGTTPREIQAILWTEIKKQYQAVGAREYPGAYETFGSASTRVALKELGKAMVAGALGSALGEAVVDDPGIGAAMSLGVAFGVKKLPAVTKVQIRKLQQAAKKGTAGVWEFDHYSQLDDLDVLDPIFMGTGKAGAEKARPHRPPAIHVYVKGAPPEPQLKGLYHHVVKAELRIYDASLDPDDLISQSRNAYGVFDPDTFEKQIINAGYDGYFVPEQAPTIVKLFKRVPVVRDFAPPHRGPAESDDWMSRRRFHVGDGALAKPTRIVAPQTPEFKRWFGNSVVIDPTSGKPLVVFHGTMDLNFDRFKKGDGGFHFGTTEQSAQRTGGWDPDNENVRVIPAFLRMENPVKLSRDPGQWYGYSFIDQLEKDGYIDTDQAEELFNQIAEVVSQAKKEGRYYVDPYEKAKPIRDFLKSEGYDGVVYPNEYEGGGDSFMVFDANQIKHATRNNGKFSLKSDSFLRGVAGPLAGAAGGAAAGEVAADDPMGGALLGAGGVGFVKGNPRFYSRLSRAIDAGPKKATAEQWAAHLSKNVAKGEREWTGIQRFLDERKGEVLSQGEVREVFSKGQLDLHETVLRANPQAPEELIRAADEASERYADAETRLVMFMDEVLDKRGQALTEWMAANPDATFNEAPGHLWRRSIGTGDPEFPEFKRLQAEVNAANGAMHEAGAAVVRAQMSAPKAQYERYTEPGGEDYREIVISLGEPAVRLDTQENIDAARAYLSYYLGGDEAAKIPDNDVIARAIAYDWEPPPPKKGPNDFQTGHYPSINNPLAHARVKTRHVNGEKVLFVEEVQSDWHQKGREHGYRTPEDKARVVSLQKEAEAAKQAYGYARAVAARSMAQYMTPAEGQTADDVLEMARRGIDSIMALPNPRAHVESIPAEHVEYQQAMRDLVEAKEKQLAAWEHVDALLDRLAMAPPEGPLKNTDEWVGLVMKRLIDEAVEGGYDRIAWATGKQNADRYSLSQVADLITWKPAADGGPGVFRAFQGNTSVFEKQVTAKELPSIIGKDAADQLLNKPSQTYQLRDGGVRHELETEAIVGGHGMRIFYDQMLPKWIRDYAKKMGVAIDVEQTKGLTMPRKGHLESLELARQRLLTAQAQQGVYERLVRGSPEKASDPAVAGTKKNLDAELADAEAEVARLEAEGSQHANPSFRVSPELREKVQTQGQYLWSNPVGPAMQQMGSMAKGAARRLVNPTPVDPAELAARDALADEHFRFDKVALDPTGEEALRERVARVVQDEGLDPKRVITWEETKAEAQAVGVDPEGLFRALKRGNVSRARIVAARQIIAENTKAIAKRVKQLEGPLGAETRARIEAELDALNLQTDQMVAIYSPARSETGRLLNAMKIVANMSLDPSLWLARATKLAGRPLADAERQAIAKLIADDDRYGLAQYVMNLKGKSVTKQLLDLRRTGLLTGLRTHGINISSNFALAVMETAKDHPAMIMDGLLSALSGRATKSASALRSLRASARGAAQGVRDAKQILLHGRRFDGGNLKWDHVVDDEIHLPGVPDAVNTLLTKYTQIVGRTLSAEDRVFNRIAFQRSLEELAAVGAKNEGLTGRAAKARARELLAAPSMEMIQTASQDALIATLQDPNALSRVAKAVQKGLGPIGEYLLPFTQAPSSVAMRAIEYSPIGFAMSANAVKDFITLVRKVARTPAQERQLMALQKLASDRFGRAAAGSLAMALGAWLVHEGLLSSGRPVAETDRDTREAMGIGDGAVKSDDEWRRIDRLAPVGALVMAGAAWYRAFTDDEEGGHGAAATAAVGALGKSVAESPFLTGVGDLKELVDDPESRGLRWLQQQPASFVPTIMGDVARTMDPTIKRGDHWLDGARAKVPGLSRRVAPKIDAMGDTVRVKGGIAPMIDFTTPRQDKRPGDPVLRALSDLNIPLSRPKAMPEEDGPRLRERQVETGQLRRRYVADAIGKIKLDTLSAAARQDLIDDVMQALRDADREARENQADRLGVDLRDPERRRRRRARFNP